MSLAHKRIVHSVASHTKEEMKGVCSAHDVYHIERVVKLATILQQKENKGDLLVVQVSARLHEALDTKFFAPNFEVTRKADLKLFLRLANLDDTRIAHIMYIIENIGFGKSIERPSDFVLTDEFKIVEDADRLEAIGAIGIARVFAYGGQKNKPIYDPAIAIDNHLNQSVYTDSKGTGTSINHFHEKLLLLKDMMHTPTWKHLATKRDAYMRKYLAEFTKERNTDIDKDLEDLI